MPLVIKFQFFHFLFSLKIRLEIRYNNVLDRKETFFDYENKNFWKSRKSHFSKGVNPCQNANFFHFFFSLKISQEIRYNNVLDRKETFFAYKNKKFRKSKKSHFSKRVNPCFWSSSANSFHFLFSLKIRLKIRYNNVLDRKEGFFWL